MGSSTASRAEVGVGTATGPAVATALVADATHRSVTAVGAIVTGVRGGSRTGLEGWAAGWGWEWGNQWEK
jgi:hypothetical protein